MQAADMETLITTTDIIMRLRDITVAADIGVMTDIIIEMMSIITTTTACLTIITIIIIPEGKCISKEDPMLQPPKDLTMVSKVAVSGMEILMVDSDKTMAKTTARDQTTVSETTNSRIHKNRRITAEDSEIIRIIAAPTVIREDSGTAHRITTRTLIRTTAGSGIILPETATLIPTAEDSETVQDQATPLPRIIIQTETEADLDKTIINKRTNS